MKKIGPSYLGNSRTIFTVWAPEKEQMILHLVHPADKKISMKKNTLGYFMAAVDDAAPGCRYYFMPDGEKDYPDPASHYQPKGVHGPSEVVDHDAFRWSDATWHGLPFKDIILYELHVGTFTSQGTFEAIIPFLDDLKDIGINAIELMPVCQFPGHRNWGYDAVYPYAVHNSYGGPEGLKKLVDACHSKGIAVFLDLVYNHLGPEGNYFSQYGPYFTDKYCTPWGDALNFDGDWSDGVRDYFSNNALHWFKTYHIDGLRLDAIHMVYDTGAIHFWELTTKKVKQLQQELGRTLYMTAESDLNSPRVIKDPELGGYGFDAQWLDDFHHALYVLLDPKGKERYEDFGAIEQLAKAYSDGFVLSGEYVKFRKRKYGTSSVGVPGQRFIVFNQNHDQVGNRVKGERLCMLVDFERMKLAAAAIMLSPYIPMLFMGEEYADQSPFFYFISHSDKELIKAVREGRKKEFENYKWEAEPPDPQDEETFNRSKLQWHKRKEGKHAIMLQWHKELIQLRRTYAALQNDNKGDMSVNILEQHGLVITRRDVPGSEKILCLFNFAEQDISYVLPDHYSSWHLLLSSKNSRWMEQQNEAIEISPSFAAGGQITIPGCSVLVLSNRTEHLAFLY